MTAVLALLAAATLATLATLADSLAFLLVIVPGRAIEANPLVASLNVAAALWARAAVIVLLVALTVLAAVVPARHLRITVGVALAVAFAVGLVGAATTIGAIA